MLALRRLVAASLPVVTVSAAPPDQRHRAACGAGY